MMAATNSHLARGPLYQPTALSKIEEVGVLVFAIKGAFNGTTEFPSMNLCRVRPLGQLKVIMLSGVG